MNQQQGDAMVEVVAEKTGLNAVLCAQHLALSLEFGRQMYPMQDSGTWSLAAWRASNAGQTMAAMTEQPEAEDDAKLRDRLAIEVCFRLAKQWGMISLAEIDRAVSGFKAGWDARAQQEGR